MLKIIHVYWLSERLSRSSATVCRGAPLQSSTADRYWALQHAKNASVVVVPTITHDVSFTMETMRKTRLVKGLAFVRGGDSTAGVSSSYGLVLDLGLLNRTMVLTYRALRSRKATSFR